MAKLDVSGFGKVAALIIAIAFLASVLADQLIYGPIAARKLSELDMMLAQIGPPSRALRHDCYRTSSPHRALAGCSYTSNDGQTSIVAHYDRSFAAIGWHPCQADSTNDKAVVQRRYCGGSDVQAVVSWGREGTELEGTMRVEFIWGRLL